MASKTKYDGLLKRTEPAQSEPVDETPEASEAAPMPPVVRKPGRPKKPLAKSKDPNMKGFTIILTIDTHADASSLLKKLRTGEDMSELVERLLATWVKENK
jgi:hypothetical protein